MCQILQKLFLLFFFPRSLYTCADVSAAPGSDAQIALKKKKKRDGESRLVEEDEEEEEGGGGD